MATRQDIVEKTYKLLSEVSDVDWYNEVKDVIPKIESVVRRVINWEMTNIMVSEAWGSKIYRSGYLPFLDSKMFVNTQKPRPLAEQAVAWDTIMEFDSSNFPESGVVYANMNTVSYTGNTDSSITGCSWIELTHDSGDMVHLLHKVPEVVSKPFKLYKIHSSTHKEEVNHYDHRSETRPSRYYEIIRHDWDDYLNIVWYWTGKFVLYYVKTNVEMTDPDSECVIPDPYAVDLVALLASGELLYEYEEYMDGEKKLNKWYWLLEELYNFYARQTKDWNKKFVVGNKVSFNNIIGNGWNTGYIRR